jgi:N-acetylneuraminic acid mutarotase
LNDGGRYNPAVNGWTAVSTNGAPSGRRLHTAVWTGREMIVWGGDTLGGYANDGSLYNPVANGWTPMSLSSAPAGRTGHISVWTGSEMFVWGGYGNDGSYFNDTFSYTPGRALFLYQRP